MGASEGSIHTISRASFILYRGLSWLATEQQSVKYEDGRLTPERRYSAALSDIREAARACLVYIANRCRECLGRTIMTVQLWN